MLGQWDSGHFNRNWNGIRKDLDWERSRRGGSMRFRSLIFLPSLLLIDDGHDNTAFPVATAYLQLFRLAILDDTTPGSC